MANMLVTGGAGFIGANFVHQTLHEHPQYDVTVLDALTYAGDVANLQPVINDIRFVEGDIRDRDTVDRLVRNADVVVHFAAESHVDNSIKDPEPFVETNVLGSFVLLESIRKHDKRFHQISTDEVFGCLEIEDPERFTELTPYNPSSPYSATKAAGDLMVKAWARTYKINATISNCANNYGPYQHIEKFIPRQITNILTGRKPRLYGSGAHVREWTHVDDHNDAVHRILTDGTAGESYVISSRSQLPNIQVVKMVLELMGKSPDDFDHVSDRPGHDLKYSTDSSKIRTELGWEPRYETLESGLRPTIEWYANNVQWWAQAKTAVETDYESRETVL